MDGVVQAALVVAALMGSTVLLPPMLARRYCRPLRQLVTGLAGLLCLLAVVALATHSTGSATGWASSAWPVSFRCDGTSALMLVLVSFISWISLAFSVRYLDGELRQGRYFQWMGLTAGAVGSMVLAADLLTYAGLWCLTSFGVHNLLLHYADRPAARRAAWTKFLISRLGDAAVIAAMCLYSEVAGSLRFEDLARAATDPAVSGNPLFQLATLALAVGVLIRSAQFPFHTWLPLAIETPTPVSALMHAGVVNAGGYLLVRTGPLLLAAPSAQLLVVVVGTVTACLASLVMLTQTSIKKKLAFSTISQLGFMLMQCGLGAGSAAMLHIVAHSLYKAGAFLGSGGVLLQQAGTRSALPADRPVRPVAWLLVLVFLCLVTWGLLRVLGNDPANKPAGWLQVGLLSLAMTWWMVEAMAVGYRKLSLRVGVAAVGLIAAYCVGFSLVDRLVPAMNLPSPVTNRTAVIVVMIAFASLFAFQMSLRSPALRQRMRNWQIHAANGFYIDSWLRRLFWSLGT